MRVARSVLGLALSGLVAGGLAIGGPAGTSAVSAATDTTANDVRVGSFNVSSVTFDSSATGDHAVWKLRRPRVAAQILAEKLDVVGVQEANPAAVYKSQLVSGDNQFMDLKNALNEKGGNYALTNEAPFNCVVATRQSSCTYQYRGASHDNKILYDTDTVSMVSQGSMRYETQTAGKYERYLVWAVLKMKATGKQFLFTNTHLDPYSPTTRVAQWKEAIAKTQSLKGSLPVIAVGDFNTTKFSTWSQEMLPYSKSRGLGDVVGQEYAVNPLRTRRAEAFGNAYLNSFNGYRRDVTTFCYCTQTSKVGNNIDWIFATNTLRVKDWKIVVDMDRTTWKLRGVIPSDHMLVRSTLVLP